jgi:hypothetical protein
MNIIYCEIHETSYVPFDGATIKQSECPWCQRDLLQEELIYIKDTFEAALNARSQKGGQQVSYSGDFQSIGPSTITQMMRWVKRWDEVLK